MTTSFDPVFDATNPHAMGHSEAPTLSITNQAALKAMVLAGTLDPHLLVIPVEALGLVPKQRNIREIIKQIISLLPVDTPNPDDDFSSVREEIERFVGSWFAAPEIEMPLWIGLATTLEEYLGEPKEDWPEWKRQVLAIFSGQQPPGTV